MDWNRYCLGYKTSHGLWTIRREGGRFWAYFNSEKLQGYTSPSVAVEEVAGGSCNWPGSLDPADCNISDDITHWGKVMLR